MKEQFFSYLTGICGGLTVLFLVWMYKRIKNGFKSGKEADEKYLQKLTEDYHYLESERFAILYYLLAATSLGVFLAILLFSLSIKLNFLVEYISAISTGFFGFFWIIGKRFGVLRSVYSNIKYQERKYYQDDLNKKLNEAEIKLKKAMDRSDEILKDHNS